MGEMEARVAKAIGQYGEPVHAGGYWVCGDDRCFQSQRQAIEHTSQLRARAAIEAMREPTEEMVRAGADSNWAEGSEYRHTAETIYRAMISAALSNPSEKRE